MGVTSLTTAGGELAGRRPQILLPTDGVGTGVEVGGDGGGAVGIVGVECEGGQIIHGDRGLWGFVVHPDRPPCSLSSEPRFSAIRVNARRSRDFAVPSGMPNTLATCRYVYPSK